MAAQRMANRDDRQPLSRPRSGEVEHRGQIARDEVIVAKARRRRRVGRTALPVASKVEGHDAPASRGQERGESGALRAIEGASSCHEGMGQDGDPNGGPIPAAAARSDERRSRDRRMRRLPNIGAKGPAVHGAHFD